MPPSKPYGRLEAQRPEVKITVGLPRRSESRPLLAFCLFLFAVATFVSLALYTRQQPYFFEDGWLKGLQLDSTRGEPHPMGQLGATFSILALNFTGWGAFFIPIGLGACAFYACFNRAHVIFPWKVLFLLFAMLSFTTLTRMIFPDWSLDNWTPSGVGGALGRFLFDEIFDRTLGTVGSSITLGLMLTLSAAGIVIEDPRRLITTQVERFRSHMLAKREQRLRIREARLEMRRKQLEALAEARKKIDAAKAKVVAAKIETPAPVEEDAKPAPAPATPPKTKPKPAFPGGVIPTEEAKKDTETEEPDTDEIEEISEEEIPDTPSTPVAPASPVRAPRPGDRVAVPQTTSSGKLTIVAEETLEKVAGTLAPKVRDAYRFPPVTLLNDPPPPDSGPPENYEERADTLIRTLGEFKIKVSPGDVQTGPVITRYEVMPAPGVRVEKIAGLANNIAMNMKAESVRVLAPVPGKGTVGVEVPNRRPKPVALREIIESKVWAENKCEIPVVLGKDVTGRPIVTDLAKMPHALIAGSTGSGKSVCINGIIASLLYHATPDDLRFIMVDPKVVEMQIYNKLPHMLIPVVTECKKVPGALKWLISEMENRYRIFAKTNVKNIAGFNAKVARDGGASSKAAQLDLSLSPEERVAASEAVSVARDDGTVKVPDKKLPYIVCIIDELADLMMVAPADIETGIARLAQLARAAGIHLILATQRPSVNVITGVIKANLPCRIAFKVTSVIDSRTILDGKGAESLIGKGDMLFIPPGAAALVRAQGAYVSEEEITKLVEYINRENGDPEFDDFVQDEIERATAEDEDADKTPTEGTNDPAEDPMIAKSWDIIRNTKRASTSMLQRRLSIGYNRAARIMDTLQERGYVGPENGSSPREILREI